MTSLPETKALLLERDQGWLTIWFNTPENRNALSDELVGELMTTLSAIRDDRTVRGVTLRGKGGVFCAGGDLKGFMQSLSGELTHEGAATMNRSGGELFARVNATPQVVVALIEGAAIAGGLGLACCADIIAVANDAKFSLTETQLGITPAQIAPYVVKRVGLNAARRLMLTGARFTGEDAARLGLADHVAADAAGLEEIEASIRKDVIRCAPGANAATKEILLATARLDPDAMMDFAAEKFADCMLSDEGREGIASFVEKRKPKWAAET
jgi:isohexenylglutaconyl-CoA hydratase